MRAVAEFLALVRLLTLVSRADYSVRVVRRESAVMPTAVTAADVDATEDDNAGSTTGTETALLDAAAPDTDTVDTSVSPWAHRAPRTPVAATTSTDDNDSPATSLQPPPLATGFSMLDHFKL